MATTNYRKEAMNEKRDTAELLQRIYEQAAANDEWPEPEAVGNLTLRLAELVLADDTIGMTPPKV